MSVLSGGGAGAVALGGGGSGGAAGAAASNGRFAVGLQALPERTSVRGSMLDNDTHGGGGGLHPGLHHHHASLQASDMCCVDTPAQWSDAMFTVVGSR